MKLLKSHVFWFVVLGILIFVIDEQTSDPLDTIVVDAALERSIHNYGIERIGGLLIDDKN